MNKRIILALTLAGVCASPVISAAPKSTVARVAETAFWGTIATAYCGLIGVLCGDALGYHISRMSVHEKRGGLFGIACGLVCTYGIWKMLGQEKAKLNTQKKPECGTQVLGQDEKPEARTVSLAEQLEGEESTE